MEIGNHVVESSNFLALMAAGTDERERKRHAGAIEAIARELDRPIQEVSVLYEDVLLYLRERASILDYLPVLATKKVRELCRRG